MSEPELKLQKDWCLQVVPNRPVVGLAAAEHSIRCLAEPVAVRSIRLIAQLVLPELPSHH